MGRAHIVTGRGMMMLAAMLMGGCLEDNPKYHGSMDMGMPPGDMPPGDMAIAPPDLPEVLIKGGTFKMGTPVDGGAIDEHPEYTVTLQDYYLDRYEVTVEAYGRCVAAIKECKEPDKGTYCNWPENGSGREQDPINCVDWTDANAFCHWVGRRLPTEEEWEYAARGMTKSEYPWGQDAPMSQACWNRSGSHGTCKVGSYRATLFGSYDDSGIFDLAGNVWEWTGSEYLPYSQPTKACGANSARCTIRGGAWSTSNIPDLRAAGRLYGTPMYRFNDVGFRCGRTAR